MSLSFPKVILLPERMHLSITNLTARPQKNSSCALDMIISDSDNFFTAESSIWWVVLSDSTNEFCARDLPMSFQVWVTIPDTPPATNLEVHDHGPCDICFTGVICKYVWYSPWRFSPSSKRMWASVSIFISNISIPWVLTLSAGVSMSSELSAKINFLYIKGILFHPRFLFSETF